MTCVWGACYVQDDLDLHELEGNACDCKRFWHMRNCHHVVAVLRLVGWLGGNGPARPKGKKKKKDKKN